MLRRDVVQVDPGDEARDADVHGVGELRPAGAHARRIRTPPALLARATGAGGQSQDVGADGFGLRGREVFQGDVRVVAGAVDLELGEPDEARGEGTREVHALHPVERRAPVRPEDHALAHLDVRIRDPEVVEAPHQPEQPDEHDDRRHEREEHDEHEVVREDPVHRVAAELRHTCGGEQRHQPVRDALAQVRDEVPEHDHQHQAALEQRSQRVHPVPLAVGERVGSAPADGRRGRRRPLPGGRRVGRAHSPVRRISATSISVSRRASAASSVIPGMSTPVVAAAVTSFSFAIPNARSTGPRVMSTSCMRP